MTNIWRLFLLLVLTSTGAACTSLSGSVRPVPVMPFSFDSAVSRQVIEVRPAGGVHPFQAVLTAWDYRQDAWRKILGPWPVVVGRNGFAPRGSKREGDGRTPSGVYALGGAFGERNLIATGLAYRQVNADDIWIDDPASADYNRWVKLPVTAASFEYMLRPDGLYEMGLIIEYNTSPVVPGDGSAIFMHIWRDRGRAPTSGCVGVDRWRLRRLLNWLETDQNPVILLGDPG
jgi:L,D-peptidoglycan transpeptidase YkuD (ErfK/YbiS/YcfS/YnhG family)